MDEGDLWHRRNRVAGQLERLLGGNGGRPVLADFPDERSVINLIGFEAVEDSSGPRGTRSAGGTVPRPWCWRCNLLMGAGSTPKAILELQDGDPLFGKGGFREWWRAKVELDKALNLPKSTRTILEGPSSPALAEIGVAPHIVEAVVNHVSGHKGGVAGVYNKAKYSAEKRAALQRWADHVERIVAGAAADNVRAFADEGPPRRAARRAQSA